MKSNMEELATLTANRDIKAAKEKHKESQMGLKRACVLRDLKYFDVGQSFVVDSLHNIYLGIFVSFSENIKLTSFLLETFVEALAKSTLQIRALECIYAFVEFG